MATVERDDRGLWKRALITAPAIVILGTLMGIVSNSGFENSWYAELQKPSFQPPSWAFGAAWTTLYTMMGIALAAILNEPPSRQRRDALWLFGGQLALNFAWSPIFFGLQMIDVAFIVIIVMLIMGAMGYRKRTSFLPGSPWPRSASSP